MADKTFSNTRTKATWKPRVGDEDLPFYERGEEGDAYLGLGDETPAFLSDPGRNPVFNLPYSNAGRAKAGESDFARSDGSPEKPARSGDRPKDCPKTAALGCDGASSNDSSNDDPEKTDGDEVLHRVQLLGLEDLPEGVLLDYSIVGGYNNNAVELSWRIDEDAYALQWAALKTFTGMQLKYVTPKKRSPLIFALADEDAYVYCDESPCLECIFMCKRGFVLYARIRGLGIVKIPLTRASAYWESRG